MNDEKLTTDDIACLISGIDKPSKCDDCISRQAVLDIIHLFFAEEIIKIPTEKTEDGDVLIMGKLNPFLRMNKTLSSLIKELPSVTAERTGHWIYHEVEDTCRWLTCSECGAEHINKKDNYCSHCGARMIGIDEKNSLMSELGCSQEFMDWLDTLRYFDCPAAKSHHGNHKHGLYEHCSVVTSRLLWLTKSLDLQWEREESPYIVGYLHDICKCDDYKYEEIDGEFRITMNESRLPGHGDKSVDMLKSKGFKLTDEEEACIRYHMGAFVEKSEWSKYSGAVHKYPNVLYTHTADMIASQIMGV